MGKVKVDLQDAAVSSRARDEERRCSQPYPSYIVLGLWHDALLPLLLISKMG